MNKKEIGELLEKKINRNLDECIFILTCIEENTSKKEIIIDEIKNKLSITTEEANNIYETTKELIKKVLKERVKHPFKQLKNKDL